MFAFSDLASAKDFRGVNFGGSCSGIHEFELNDGSKHLEKDDSEFYRYENVYLDRVATIAYRCIHDMFLTGYYTYRFPSLQSANEFYDVTVPQLEFLYGQPISESREIGYGSSAMWISGKISVFVVVTNHDDVRASVGIVVKHRDK